MDRFDVKIMWDETEGEIPCWISECPALGVFLCDESLNKLVRENRLAAETMREIDGKSMDFTLDFKIETPDVMELAAA
jgi:hypothetical protein